MREKGVTTYDFAALEGFIAAKVLTNGIRAAGTDLTRESLLASLNNMELHDVGGFMVDWTTGDHQASGLVEPTLINSKGNGFIR